MAGLACAPLKSRPMLSMSNEVAMYCGRMHCTALPRAVLYCTAVLSQVALDCTLLYCSVLYCIPLSCPALLSCQSVMKSQICSADLVQSASLFLHTKEPRRPHACCSIPSKEALCSGLTKHGPMEALAWRHFSQTSSYSHYQVRPVS